VSARGLHLHFEPTSGIAGDMAVAALVDAGVPAAVVRGAIEAMGVRGLRVTFGRRTRGAFVGRSFDVTWPGRPRAKRQGAHEHAHPHSHEGTEHGHEDPGERGHAATLDPECHESRRQDDRGRGEQPEASLLGRDERLGAELGLRAVA